MLVNMIINAGASNNLDNADLHDILRKESSTTYYKANNPSYDRHYPELSNGIVLLETIKDFKIMYFITENRKYRKHLYNNDISDWILIPRSSDPTINIQEGGKERLASHVNIFLAINDVLKYYDVSVLDQIENKLKKSDVDLLIDKSPTVEINETSFFPYGISSNGGFNVDPNSGSVKYYIKADKPLGQNDLPYSYGNLWGLNNLTEKKSALEKAWKSIDYDSVGDVISRTTYGATIGSSIFDEIHIQSREKPTFVGFHTEQDGKDTFPVLLEEDIQWKDHFNRNYGSYVGTINNSAREIMIQFKIGYDKYTETFLVPITSATFDYKINDDLTLRFNNRNISIVSNITDSNRAYTIQRVWWR